MRHSKTPSRNSKVLRSFVEYCEANPEYRFWQALRNWCGWPTVAVGSKPAGADTTYYEDTFFWEKRNG